VRGKRRLTVVVRTTFTAAGARPAVAERRMTLKG
jgi:hypothetical protein